MATPWQVPAMWEGRTVAVLASGPSMSAATADAVRAARLPAVAVNDTYRLAPWADMLYAADSGWWRHHAVDALRFAGLKVTCDAGTPFPQVLGLRNAGADGFENDPGAVRTGGNGAYQAVHIAAHAGAARILLFGLDFHGTHWHGRHAEPLANTAPYTFTLWAKQFAALAVLLDRRGVRVVNATPGSALNCFPVIEPDLALRWALMQA
jgi:hypothetical protein